MQETTIIYNRYIYLEGISGGLCVPCTGRSILERRVA
jgi:hypothetical protein